jgi:hypothetical protein
MQYVAAHLVLLPKRQRHRSGRARLCHLQPAKTQSCFCVRTTAERKRFGIATGAQNQETAIKEPQEKAQGCQHHISTDERLGQWARRCYRTGIGQSSRAGTACEEAKDDAQEQRIDFDGICTRTFAEKSRIDDAKRAKSHQVSPLTLT